MKRHFNCIKVRQYVRISCLELTNCDCVKGGGDISGKQWQLPAAQATGVRTRPYLAHIHEPALISLVYEAVDDEPGLPVCLEIRCLNRWWIGGKENLWQTQKGSVFLQPSHFSLSLSSPSLPVPMHNLSKFSKKPLLSGSPPWPLFPCLTFPSQESLPPLGLDCGSWSYTFHRFFHKLFAQHQNHITS